MAIGNEKVRRYEPRMIGIEDRPHEAGMYADLHGHYVLHSAYAELAAERDKLKVALTICGYADRTQVEAGYEQALGLLAMERNAAESQLAELRGKCEGLSDEWQNSAGWESSFQNTMLREHSSRLRALAAADGELNNEVGKGATPCKPD